MSWGRIPLLPMFVRWGLVVIVAAIILAGSIGRVEPQPAQPTPFWDKQLHFVAYATLAGSLAYATANSNLRGNRRVALVIGVAVVFGILMELIQLQLPGRFFSYGDVLANSIGCVLVLGWFPIESRITYLPITFPSNR